MNEPSRPSNISADAVWVPDRKEFRVCQLVNGLPEGKVHWYRPDGSLACISTYAAGKSHGPYERFHENGEWSQRGQMRDGNRHGLCSWRRSTGATTEGTIPPSIPENVREARILFEDGLPGPNRYYDAEGAERVINGKPLPQRPAGVDERAGVNDEGVWFFGWGAQDPATRHGTWKWWSPSGVLTQQHEYRKGKCLAELKNHADGSPQLRKYKDARGWDLVQRCFDAAGAEVDVQGTEIPPRPQGVPDGAVFDSMKSRWVAGFDPSTLPPMGLITLYELDGTKDEELEFAGGQLRACRRYNRNGSLLSQSANDEQGREVLDVLYSANDGAVRHRIERAFDAQGPTSVDIEADGSRSRGRKGEAGMAWEFFDSDGKLTARGSVAGKKAVGVWEFVDAGVSHQLDLSGLGLRADVDEDFEPSRLLGAALLSRNDYPRVEALTGVDDLDWSEVPACYGKDLERFPKYLCALAAPVPAVRAAALGRIYSETLHQGTIYVATAKVVPFMLRLLQHPNADPGALLGYVEAVTSQAHDYREEALEWDEDSDDRVAVLGTLEALEREFPRVAALVDSPDLDLVASALALASRAGKQGEALLLRAARHSEGLVAATAVHGLLDQLGDRLTAEVAKPWLEHADPIVRLSAAIATARHQGAASPPRTSVVLREAMDGGAELAGRFSQLPFVKGRLLAYVALSLGKVRDDVAMGCALPLAMRLSDLDLFTLDSVSFGLLQLCFGDGQPPYAPAWLQVLEGIASCGRLEGFANFSQSSARFGLPSGPSEYRVLVETLRKEADPQAYLAELLQADEEEEEEEEEAE